MNLTINKFQYIMEGLELQVEWNNLKLYVFKIMCEYPVLFSMNRYEIPKIMHEIQYQNIEETHKINYIKEIVKTTINEYAFEVLKWDWLKKGKQ